MYSNQIEKQLDQKGIEIGDKVKVNGKEGKLMPKPKSGNPETIVLKLDNGYNIGLKGEVELVEKREQEETEKPDLEHKSDKKDILVLHTGGTIASKVSYEEGGVKPSFDPEDLLEMYPEVAEEVNIHSEVVAQMLSEDMEPGHWQEIAEKIDEIKENYDGIIIGHGTDTMAYTGAALSLMLKGINTGVLLVGAQRSSDRPSSDASMNLYCAAKFLKETSFKGIGICMHKTSNDIECVIIPGNKARKMHTSRRDAFKTINTDPIATVNYQTDEIKSKEWEKNTDYEKRTSLNPNVGLIKITPGMNTDEIEFLINQDYDGVIIEGTGLGHMPVNSFDEKTSHHEEILEKLGTLTEDTLTVMSSQCINGRVNMDVYETGLKIKNAGVIEAKDMHPELAYVKLMWALGNSDNAEEAASLFQKNINNEITDRSLYNAEY